MRLSDTDQLIFRRREARCLNATSAERFGRMNFDRNEGILIDLDCANLCRMPRFPRRLSQTLKPYAFIQLVSNPCAFNRVVQRSVQRARAAQHLMHYRLRPAVDARNGATKDIQKQREALGCAAL